jgi:hypothetical protein
MLSVLNLFAFYFLVVVAGALEMQDVEELRNTAAHIGSRTAPSVQLRNDAKEHLSFIFYRPTWFPTLPSATPPPATTVNNEQRKNDTWTFKVESGNKGVQVGSWATDVIYNWFLKALRERCDQTKKGGVRASVAEEIGDFTLNTRTNLDIGWKRETLR